MSLKDKISKTIIKIILSTTENINYIEINTLEFIKKLLKKSISLKHKVKSQNVNIILF